jgi:hypothetical protein
LADVKFPILGADLLRKHGLLVDHSARCHINTSTLQKHGSAISIALNSGLLASIEATPSPFRSLFSYFQAEANPLHTLPPVRHEVEHGIEASSAG